DRGTGHATAEGPRLARALNDFNRSGDLPLARRRAGIAMNAPFASAPRTSLFPPLEPHRRGNVAVDPLHTLPWEESGNPNGVPVVFLHGGPGGGCSPRHRQFFDPAFYRIVLFDQRGAGHSTPVGEVRNNTTQHLIDDMER